jgi:hypothetical protein
VKNQPDVLSQVDDFIARYLHCSEHQRAVLVLWVLHTYCVSAAQVTPFLSIRSAYKQSGKTLCLQLLALLCHDPALTVGFSASTLNHRMKVKPPSAILLDECQATFGTRARSKAAALRALLAASYHRGFGYTGPIGERSLFCPKAFAGRGELPEELADRSLPIILGPWGAGAVLGFATENAQILGSCATTDPGRLGDCVVRLPQPENVRFEFMGQGVEPPSPVQPFDMRLAAQQAQPIKELLDAWASRHLPRLEKLSRFSSQDFDPGLSLRRRDLCEPLVQLADAVGGDWPRRARRALMVLFLDEAKFHLQPGLQMLQDLRDCFSFHSYPLRLSSFVLVEWLRSLPPRPWDLEGPINPARLARMLVPFDVRPRLQRTGPPVGSPKLGPPSPTRGYLLEDLVEAWQKHLGYARPYGIPGLSYPEPHPPGPAYGVPASQSCNAPESSTQSTQPISATQSTESSSSTPSTPSTESTSSTPSTQPTPSSSASPVPSTYQLTNLPNYTMDGIANKDAACNTSTQIPSPAPAGPSTTPSSSSSSSTPSTSSTPSNSATEAGVLPPNYPSTNLPTYPMERCGL